MMRRLAICLYGFVYSLLAAGTGAVVGIVAGVGIAASLLHPEEANILYAGVGYGGPAGALVGLAPSFRARTYFLEFQAKRKFSRTCHSIRKFSMRRSVRMARN